MSGGPSFLQCLLGRYPPGIDETYVSPDDFINSHVSFERNKIEMLNEVSEKIRDISLVEFR